MNIVLWLAAVIAVLGLCLGIYMAIVAEPSRVTSMKDELLIAAAWFVLFELVAAVVAGVGFLWKWVS